eukprot:5032603-Prymnesium_polylepis.2
MSPRRHRLRCALRRVCVCMCRSDERLPLVPDHGVPGGPRRGREVLEGFQGEGGVRRCASHVGCSLSAGLLEADSYLQADTQGPPGHTTYEVPPGGRGGVKSSVGGQVREGQRFSHRQDGDGDFLDVFRLQSNPEEGGTSQVKLSLE